MGRYPCSVWCKYWFFFRHGKWETRNEDKRRLVSLHGRSLLFYLSPSCKLRLGVHWSMWSHPIWESTDVNSQRTSKAFRHFRGHFKLLVVDGWAPSITLSPIEILLHRVFQIDELLFWVNNTSWRGKSVKTTPLDRTIYDRLKIREINCQRDPLFIPSMDEMIELVFVDGDPSIDAWNRICLLRFLHSTVVPR